MKFRPAVFRPLSGRVLSVVVAVIAVVAIGALVAAGDALDLVRFAWVPLFAAVLCAALYWAPVLRVDEHAIVVRNVFRTFHVPWTAVQRIDTKYALTLFTPERRIPVWVAPAPSRFATGGFTPRDARLVAESARAADRSVRPGDIASTASGAPAEVIRRHWQELRDDGVLDRVGPQAIRVEVHVGTIALLAALAAASAAGLLL